MSEDVAKYFVLLNPVPSKLQEASGEASNELSGCDQIENGITGHRESDIMKIKKIQEQLDLEVKKEIVKNFQYSQIDYAICCVSPSPCSKCKNKCVSCKYPCQKCASNKTCRNSYTDTDDFDKYLEILLKKLKSQPKLKTIGVDTCDLESHFDYYKLEKESVRIQKSVATDCTDLNQRRLQFTRSNKHMQTNTCNVKISNSTKTEETDTKYEITNPLKKNSKLQCIEDSCEIGAQSENFFKNSIKDPLSTGDEDASQLSSFSENMVDKENVDINCSFRDVTFDTSTDDSDVDLITSCKLSKFKEMAKKHKLCLKEINSSKGIHFKCVICNDTFQEKHAGTLHLGNHVVNNDFKCLSCSEIFTSLDALFSHTQITHLNQLEYSATLRTSHNSISNNLAEKKGKSKKIYNCALCSNKNDYLSQFTSYKTFYLHKKLKHGEEKSIKKNDSAIGKRVRIKQEFICLICGKEFKSSKALKDHSPVHTGQKNYLCDICNKSYTTSANLKIHKRTHTGARNFVCSVCNKAFHKKDSLKVHFRKHSGERPFQCDLCPMRFDRNYILKNHRYTHFSEKTFICPFCGKTFTTHGGLNNHEKSHKKDPFAKKPRKPAVKPTLETENAVICDVCGKIYSTKSNLRIHKFVHLGIKPFECSVCHQSYAKKDSMLTHMRKHFDDRPFACEICGMKFYRNHTLKTHLLRHTGERPHKCKICDKSFTQSSSLAYHVKNHDRKIEKKKSTFADSSKPKKKGPNTGMSKTGESPKTVSKSDKIFENFQSNDAKPLLDGKKSLEKNTQDVNYLKNPVPVCLSEKDASIKNAGFLLTIPDKDILVLDKNLSVNMTKEVDILEIGKNDAGENQVSVGKFNYYIAKSHVFSLSKSPTRGKPEKNDEIVENAVLTGTSYIGKEGPEASLSRESNLKSTAADVIVREGRLDLKSQPAVPFAGEILNATLISNENGEVIPFASMTLQGLNADNVMIGPVLALEATGKELGKNPKSNSSLPSLRLTGEKSTLKPDCHVINIKDARIPQKIHIEMDSSTVQVQALEEGAVIQEISGFCNGSFRQNEL